MKTPMFNYSKDVSEHITSNMKRYMKKKARSVKRRIILKKYSNVLYHSFLYLLALDSYMSFIILDAFPKKAFLHICVQVAMFVCFVQI